MEDVNTEELRTNIQEAIHHRNDELHSSPRVKELAAKGARNPETLTDDETAELCGFVIRHIEMIEERRDHAAL